MKASPVTRMGWHEYYVDLFNKTDGKRGEHLANWFLLLHLAFDEQTAVETTKPTKVSKRALVAKLLWHIVMNDSNTEYVKTAAKGLLEHKKTCKVGWHVLGLPDDADKTLIDVLC